VVFYSWPETIVSGFFSCCEIKTIITGGNIKISWIQSFDGQYVDEIIYFFPCIVKDSIKPQFLKIKNRS